MYEGGVFFNGDVFRARRETLPYMVVEAGPDAVFKGPSTQRRKGKTRWILFHVSRAACPEVKGPK